MTDAILESNRVCGKHFVHGIAAKPWDRCNVDWIPTLNLGDNKIILKADPEKAAERSERVKERRLKRLQQEEKAKEEEIAAKRQALNDPGDMIADIAFSNACNEDHQLENDASTQTEEFYFIYESRRTDAKPFDWSELLGDDNKVLFYTGLPKFEILDTIFRHTAPFVIRKSQNLSPFQEFMMTLIKLRLDTPMQDLAYRFGVSLPTVSRVFLSWMVVLDTRLSPLVSWSDRGSLWKPCQAVLKFLLEIKQPLLSTASKCLFAAHQICKFVHRHFPTTNTQHCEGLDWNYSTGFHFICIACMGWQNL